MPPPMQVSVVIPCFNAAPCLPDAIASVVRQGVSETEILVVDDASTDETAALAERLSRQVPNLRLLRQPANGGASAARNAGLRQARGRYVCFLDADDAYGDSVLATATRFLDAAPWLQAVDFPIRLVDTHRDVHPRLLKAMANTIPSNLMARREIVRSIGGFPEDPLFCTARAGEDWAFRRALQEWGRIHRLGGIHLDYAVRRGSHFDQFLDHAHVENDVIRFAPRPDDAAIVEAQAAHLQRVRDRLRAAAGIGRTRRLRYVAGDRQGDFETPDSDASLRHATETLGGKICPKIPALERVESVLDIGAGIGASAVFFAAIYPDTRIVAVEPARRKFPLLRTNTIAQRDIDIYNIGLRGPESGEEARDPGAQSIADGPQLEALPLAEASAFVKDVRIERPDIIRLDTGGSEAAIMSALAPSFRSARAVYAAYGSEADRQRIERVLDQTHRRFAHAATGPASGRLVYCRKDIAPSATGGRQST